MNLIDSPDLEQGYREMAADTSREVEATEWLAHLVLPDDLPHDRRFRAQIIEVVNRNELVTELLRLGLNAYLPVYDRGVDLIDYRDSDGIARPVQLKGRWLIDRKYIGLDVWIAFKDCGVWYIASHEAMVTMGERLGYCATNSWVVSGTYHCSRLGKELLQLMEPFKLTHGAGFME